MRARRIGALLGCLLLAGTAGAPQATAKVAAEASAAAGFLKRELVRLDHTFPGSLPNSVDGGLVADTLIGLHAAEETGPEFRAATAKLRGTFFSATVSTSGIIAKYLMVAERAGVDPAAWGKDSAGKPVDLVRRLAATLDDNGRYRNLRAGEYDPRQDTSNVFSQSLALIAMHEQDPTADQGAAVDYLVRQQCPGGGFRAAPPPADVTSRCTSAEPTVGVDFTAMAVWALAETGGDRAALDRALAWLRDRQGPEGGFVAEGSANANSTGLAALALTRAGDTRDAGRAAGWLVSMQLPADISEPAMAGAVAYNADRFGAIAKDPAGFWSGSGAQDQLRRATAQAVLGLSATPPTDVPDPPDPGPDPAPDPGPAPGPGPGKPGPGGSPGPDRVPGSADRAGADARAAGNAADAAAADAVAAQRAAEEAARAADGIGAGLSAPPAPPAPPSLRGVPEQGPPEVLSSIGRVEALPPEQQDFADFLRGPWGIGASVLLGFLIAGAGYWLVLRRFGRKGTA